MDDLDRLHHRLVTVLGEEAPHLLSGQFTLGDVPRQLVPYRLHRRTLGLDSLESYNQAVLRLASGERGYLTADATVREAARQALLDPAVDLDAFLARHGHTRVALGASGGGGSRGTAEAPSAPIDASAATTDAQTAASRPVPPDPVTTASAGLDISVVPSDPPAATPRPSSDAANAAPTMPFPTRPPTPVVGGSCRYCARPLPTGREVTFCPHCGENVTRVRCPACSTELEIQWQFCITCGRALDVDAGLGEPSSGGRAGGSDAPDRRGGPVAAPGAPD
jgi:hypothetical protein